MLAIARKLKREKVCKKSNEKDFLFEDTIRPSFPNSAYPTLFGGSSWKFGTTCRRNNLLAVISAREEDTNKII